jgi:acyl dehydratase
MAELYLEDFAVGQRFLSATHAIDADQIKAFASQFDPQPFHTDEAAARDSFFHGLAASGWHTASITMSLLVRSGMPIAGGLIGAGCEIAWPRPTRPGDVLQVESEVLAVTPSRSRPERGMITLKSETKNQKGEVVQVLTSKMLVWKRPLNLSAAFRGATLSIFQLSSPASEATSGGRCHSEVLAEPTRAVTDGGY